MTTTYTISVQASALRTMKVRAASAAEAVEIAEGRIARCAGPWIIDFPGGGDEHWSVEAPGGTWLGPDSMGDYLDGDHAE